MKKTPDYRDCYCHPCGKSVRPKGKHCPECGKVLFELVARRKRNGMSVADIESILAERPSIQHQPGIESLVFGVIEGSRTEFDGMVDVEPDLLIFMPESIARRNAVIHGILDKAEKEKLSWVEVQKIAPKDVYDEALKLAKKVAESFPIKETFEVPQAGDGEWPSCPFQGMRQWLPKKVVKTYGTQSSSGLHQKMLRFDPANLEDILNELDASGMPYRHDPKLVHAASGYTYDGA